MSGNLQLSKSIRRDTGGGGGGGGGGQRYGFLAIFSLRKKKSNGKPFPKELVSVTLGEKVCPPHSIELFVCFLLFFFFLKPWSSIQEQVGLFVERKKKKNGEARGHVVRRRALQEAGNHVLTEPLSRESIKPHRARMFARGYAKRVLCGPVCQEMAELSGMRCLLHSLAVGVSIMRVAEACLRVCVGECFSASCLCICTVRGSAGEEKKIKNVKK